MTADPLVGFENDDLRFERLLGRGAMGSVYRGVQLVGERTVAIKVIAEHLSGDPEHRVRFEREGRTLGRLTHPHIVGCHFVGPTEGPDGRELFVMVLEYVEGWTLGSLLRRGVLTVRRTLDLHRQVAEALAYAHENGVIHRDIKPENILVTRQGEAKVADFGLAKLTDATLLTTTGVILGSPAYMSPEACQAQALTAASDLYSLGCSLFHCLTGRLPYPAGSSLQMLNLHVTAPVPVLSQLRPDLAALDDLIQRLLAKHPLERHADGRIVAQILQTVLPRIPSSMKAGQPSSGMPSETEPVPPVVVTPATRGRTVEPPGRQLRVTVLGMAVVVALVLALVWMIGHRSVAVVDPTTVREQFSRIAERIAVGRADDLEQAGWQLDTIRQLGVALPEELRSRVPGLEQAIAQGWDRIRESLDRQLATTEELVQAQRFDEALAILKELNPSARFPAQRTTAQALRARIVAAVPDIEADVPGRTWVVVENDGARPPVGSLTEIPGPVPGGCGRVVTSRATAEGQRLMLSLPAGVRVAEGDGLTLVLHARSHRALDVATASGRRLGGSLLEGRDWQVVRLSLGASDGDGRLVLTMAGTVPFALAKAVYGRGAMPSSEAVGVAAGTLVPPVWSGDTEHPGFHDWLLRSCRQHPGFPDPRRLVLARWGGGLSESESQTMLQRIDRVFAPDAGDLSPASRVLTWAELLTEVKRQGKAGASAQIVVVPLFTRPDPSREELEMLRRGLQAVRLRGILPVVVWRRQDGGTQTDSAPGAEMIRSQWPGVPFVDLDRVASFLADNHLGTVDQAQLDAGLEAGFGELAERIRWALQEGGVGAEAQRKLAGGATGK